MLVLNEIYFQDLRTQLISIQVTTNGKNTNTIITHTELTAKIATVVQKF